jgi:hypothetical protein
MKRACPWRSLIAAAVYCTATQYVFAQQPAYAKNPWASFRPGSWSRLMITNKNRDEPIIITWMLMSVTAKAATVKTELRRGPTVVTTDNIDFPIPYSLDPPDSVSETLLKFKGQELKCYVLRYHAKNKVTWRCPDVPGFVALDQTPQTITTLLDFENK